MSDAPSAAWHPALMPNAPAAVAPAANVEEPEQPSSATLDKDQSDEPIESKTSPQTIDPPADSKPEVDAWFQGDDGDNSWLEQPAQGEDANDNSAGDHVGDDDVEDAQSISATAAKHASTVSFARTVSHEVNWMDDEDPEWSLPRTDTDPFKFMPPNDRTNSFPQVPPVTDHIHDQTEEPLPHNQAEDVIHEIEHEIEQARHEPTSHSSNALHQDTFWGNEEEASDFPTQSFLGGDLQGPDEEASEARFAEGLPLIPHQQAEGAEQGDNILAHDAFSHDAAATDDDFFQQLGGANGVAPEEPLHESLQRKSTMQVIDSLNTNPSSSLGFDLEDTAEGDEESDVQPSDVVAESEVVPDQNGQKGEGEDLAAKWEQAFAADDDDDFLLDDSATDNKEAKSVDPAAFFADDDEGFLDDHEDQIAPAQPAPEATTVPSNQSQGINGRYLPSDAVSTQAPPITPSNPYLPAASPFIAQQPVQNPYGTVTTPFAIPPSAPPAVSGLYNAPASRPEPNKAQSFADKAKGGYHSPYDLPMEVVKPRKRASMQHIPRSTGSPIQPGPPPPPRSTSMNGPGAAPAQEPAAVLSPPSSSHSNQAPPLANKPPPQLRSKSSFFEDLPMTSKPRPASRHSLPSPSQPSPLGPPPAAQTHSHTQHLPTPPQEPHVPSQPPIGDVPKLVAPERVNPYAQLHSATGAAPSLPPTTSSRYSPAPPSLPGAHGTVHAAGPSRYSPAPPPQRSPSGYAPAPPPVLPHQPRTSSPLAHFEVSSQDRSRSAPAQHSEPGLHERRSSSSLYEPRLNRVSSLPPTREVDEDEPAALVPVADQVQPSLTHPTTAADSRYGQLANRPRKTPPPPLGPSYAQATLSPPKRGGSNYTPHSHPSISPQTHEFIPPQRSQTQSPGALYGNRPNVKPLDPVPRPSSVHGPMSPGSIAPVSVQAPLSSRPRGFSQNLKMVPPTDGRENDPLQRWKGAPVAFWGVGGTMVTSFPKDIPRYGIGQALPMITRSPGEVKIKSIKDTDPLEERLAKFPGPLKGKSKKKETISWLSTGIEELEKNLPSPSFQTQISHEHKRAEERVLLWKILRLFVEYDGVLEGNAAVDKAVRDVLSPGSDGSKDVLSPIYATGAESTGLHESSTTQMQADSVDSTTIEQIKNSLVSGDREQAVWAAADKRLWGHALLIANTVSPDLYHKVSQEFIKKEVNIAGHNNESLAALYAVLSGNHEESVDELVPVHARAGLQMVSKSLSTGPAKAGLEGLDKWRETLTLILSNRSSDDTRALNSLGNLLSGYGRAEAAHICFIFARNNAVFGGLDDPQSSFVLVGADHKRQAEQFAKETEPLLLSEVYEYGLSLAGTSNIGVSCPHLAAYKFQHAMTLAEYGFRDKALQYCEVIFNAINSQTRRSPYHHAVLEGAVEDLMKRLKQAPKEESGSWIPKPSMNKVSDSMWNRFNKFVAGDENESSGQGSPGAADETGPFARIAGGTPTISRPPSTSNAMEMFGNGNSYPGAPIPAAPLASPPATRAASRYAPMAAQPASASSSYEPSSAYNPPGRSSMERSSGEYSRSSHELPRQSLEHQSSYTNGYVPPGLTSSQSYPGPGLAASGGSPYMPNSHPAEPFEVDQPSVPATIGYSPYAPQAPSGGASPYAPAEPAPETKEGGIGTDSTPSYGYQPPSYGYEPPSLTTPEESQSQAPEHTSSGGYEPPSYQPYGYEPPSYEANPEPTNDDGDSGSEKAKPKKSFMDDEDDDIPALRSQTPGEKSKAEKDKENEELFRKAAEEDGKCQDVLERFQLLIVVPAKRAAAEKEAKAKKGWGFGGWFGGAKKETLENSPNKPVRANLGEQSSFYYDPDQKRWINKKAGAEDNAPKKATPPPPRGIPRSATGTPPLPAATSMPELGRASAPPPRTTLTPSPLSNPNGPPSNLAAPPLMARSVSNTSAPGAPPSGPPSRPTTSMSNASSIDDLLGAAGTTKRGPKKPKKGGRYVDVMAK